jgi:integrase
MTSKRLNWDLVNTYSRELIDNKKNYNDFMLGIYLQIALRSALRGNDILKLKKSNFNFNTGTCKLVTQKTNVPFSFALPDWLMKLIETIETEDVFHNKKYGCTYSIVWVNLRLKKRFGNAGVSSHSIRKSAGLKMYQNAGVNGASNFLTHKSLQHTRTYLELDELETLQLQKNVFGNS